MEHRLTADEIIERAERREHAMVRSALFFLVLGICLGVAAVCLALALRG